MFYELRDINPYHHNCGHYPEWVVREQEGDPPSPVPATRRGTPLAHADRADAEAAAARLNAASLKAWRDFLNV